MQALAFHVERGTLATMLVAREFVESNPAWRPNFHPLPRCRNQRTLKLQAGFDLTDPRAETRHNLNAA